MSGGAAIPENVVGQIETRHCASQPELASSFMLTKYEMPNFYTDDKEIIALHKF